MNQAGRQASKGTEEGACAKKAHGPFLNRLDWFGALCRIDKSVLLEAMERYINDGYQDSFSLLRRPTIPLHTKLSIRHEICHHPVSSGRR